MKKSKRINQSQSDASLCTPPPHCSLFIDDCSLTFSPAVKDDADSFDDFVRIVRFLHKIACFALTNRTRDAAPERPRQPNSSPSSSTHSPTSFFFRFIKGAKRAPIRNSYRQIEGGCRNASISLRYLSDASIKVPTLLYPSSPAPCPLLSVHRRSSVPETPLAVVRRHCSSPVLQCPSS